MFKLKRYGHGSSKEYPNRIDTIDILSGTWCKSKDVESLEDELDSLLKCKEVSDKAFRDLVEENKILKINVKKATKCIVDISTKHLDFKDNCLKMVTEYRSNVNSKN